MSRHYAQGTETRISEDCTISHRHTICNGISYQLMLYAVLVSRKRGGTIVGVVKINPQKITLTNKIHQEANLLMYVAKVLII